MKKRSYRQVCGIARALDVVGERWTLLIIRDLLLGGRRYSDLLEELPGITTNLLADRLRALTDAGVVRTRKLPPPAGSQVYELTDVGRKLEPALLALGAFGACLEPRRRTGDHTNVRWAMVSLKRRYRGCPRRWSVELRIDELVFSLGLGADALDVRDGPARSPDLVLSGNRAAFAELLFGSEGARALIDRGALEREGPARAQTDLVHAIGAAA